MKRLSIPAVLLLSILSFASQLGAEPQFGRNDRDRVCFYQDIHFQGWEDCFSPGDEVANLRGRKNAISSIRIFGRARVIVWDNEDFRGPSAEFNSDVPDLGRRSIEGSKTWSDRIESFRISSGFNTPLPGRGAGRNDRDDDRNQGRNPRSMRDGVCVYEHANFQGRSDCWDAGEEARDLGRMGWNDRITSIRVFGRAAAGLYRDVGFRGEQIVIDRDVSDLAIIQLRGGITWNDQISSLEVLLDRGPSRGRGRGPRW